MPSDKVMELQKLTGSGMNDCFDALKYSNNDIPLAVAYLKAKGLAVATPGLSFDERVKSFLPKKSCTYCTEDRDGYKSQFVSENRTGIYPEKIKLNIVETFPRGNVELVANLFGRYTPFKINFCPICGRPLIK